MEGFLIKELILKNNKVFKDYFVNYQDDIYITNSDFENRDDLFRKGYISKDNKVLKKFFDILEENKEENKEKEKLIDFLKSKIRKKIIFSKFNIFVGSNNSGKSRFIREIASMNFVDTKLNSSEINNWYVLHDSFKNIKPILEKFVTRENSIRIKDEKLFEINSMEAFDYFKWINIFKERFHKIKDKLARKENSNQLSIDPEINLLYEKLISLEENKFKRVYIPTIRGLKGFNDKKEANIDYYKIRTIRDYFLTPISKEHIFRGGQDSPGEKYYIELQRENFIEDYEKNKERVTMKFLALNDWYGLLKAGQMINQKSVYAGLKEKTFEKIEKAGLEIFTGLNLYEEIKSMLLGEETKRKKVKEFEDFLKDNFFNGKSITLIPKEKDEVLSIKIGEDEDYPIYNLGDGIQSIIIMTFPLFKYKDENLLLFIEEPEIYIPPSLQRKLLDVYLDKKYEKYNSKVQYFITTHSNHFLDLSIDQEDISIFSFKKECIKENEKNKSKFVIEKVQGGDENILKLLGVRNSSVYLSNCTIWVEGITDRLYLRKYLEIYQKDKLKKFQEDIHFSFVEYGGNNITHWSFLEDYNITEQKRKEPTILVDRLCGKLFLIADRDKGKDERHKYLINKLGDRFYCLECKEIENLLSKKILLEVIKKYPRVKILNENFKENNYKGIGLGKFIDENILESKESIFAEKSGTIKNKNKAEKSGTIKNKTDFCNKAIILINNLDDLSEEAKGLSKKIYEFIKKNNLNNDFEVQ